jgi:2-oxoglutarate dehydrogenase E2 component (dihydrolipoamide succinyltransferase)
MPVDIVIPNVGESVTNGVISVWRKKDGERVERDDVVLDLETTRSPWKCVPPPRAPEDQGQRRRHGRYRCGGGEHR